ncbi:MAG: T9SS type A sorting domain-containing protein [Bacteroidetes bacterium]|nr:T9SS type A sorting domain-containing protein [Bacteroidota bacterium]
MNELDGNKIQASNYPNPFNQTTTIKYNVPENATLVNIIIFDANGNVLKTLVNETKSVGDYEIVFNGLDLSNGVYFYQVNIGNVVGTKKMIKME